MTAQSPCNCPAMVQPRQAPGASPCSPGQTTQFTCTCEYVDCNGAYSYQNETAGAYWSSSNTAVAKVSTGGLATAVAAGTAAIKASHMGCATNL
jgi:hypothetical protein